jgi:BadF/BadG/BcrA/BcrD ATPase family
MVATGALYLGVDGGGSRCRARIEDEYSAVLGEGGTGPATTRVGIDKAWHSVMSACAIAAEQAGLKPEDFALMHAGIGLAGFGRAGAEAILKEIVHPFASVRFISDCLSRRSWRCRRRHRCRRHRLGRRRPDRRPRNPFRRIWLSDLGRRQRRRHRIAGNQTRAASSGLSGARHRGCLRKCWAPSAMTPVRLWPGPNGRLRPTMRPSRR